MGRAAGCGLWSGGRWKRSSGDTPSRAAWSRIPHGAVLGQRQVAAYSAFTCFKVVFRPRFPRPHFSSSLQTSSRLRFPLQASRGSKMCVAGNWLGRSARQGQFPAGLRARTRASAPTLRLQAAEYPRYSNILLYIPSFLNFSDFIPLLGWSVGGGYFYLASRHDRCARVRPSAVRSS